MDAHASWNATANRSHVAASTNHSGWTLHDVAYADRWAQYTPAVARWETVTGRLAPEPTVVGKRGGRRLSGRFVEWLMGWPDGWVTDLVDNTAALRLCGNGVVRQQGAAALQMLAASS
jgi:DNA (cytosine-5)-methyltransferase 1